LSEKQPYESLPLVEAYYRNEWVKAHHIMNETSKGHLIMDVGTDVAYWVVNIREIKEPTKRPMTHKEIFKAIHEGALTRRKRGHADNYWNDDNNIQAYQISYDFGETFEPMEVEE
jgi:hypothetical protein